MKGLLLLQPFPLLAQFGTPGSGLAGLRGNEPESIHSAVSLGVRLAISLHYGYCRLTIQIWAWDLSWVHRVSPFPFPYMRDRV